MGASPWDHRTTWNAERIVQLKQLWAEGLSASQIARELGGITRNSVLAKVHRLGVAKREFGWQRSPGARTGKPRAKRKSGVSYRAIGNAALKFVPEPEEVIVDLPADESPFAVMIDELSARTCRWPLGEPGPEMLYCGDGPLASYPYCPRHCRLAYRKPERAA